MAGRISYRSHAVGLLVVFAVAVMVIPSNAAIKPIGASGYPASLVGMLAFVAWIGATVLGLHDPRLHRHPIRSALCLLWLSALASYVLMDRSTLTAAEMRSADRFVIQLAVITGVAFVAAEGLRSLREMRRVLRALSWGGAFCGVVASLQFWLTLDITPYLRLLPGLSLTSENAGILTREALNRVAGTAIHPIELGVVAGMLLPLAIYVAIYDADRAPPWRRWTPVALIAVAIPTSVSRSALLAALLAIGTLVVLMPVRQRLVALCAVPFALVAVFMSAPGVIGAFASLVGAGGSDPSVMTRVDDYPLVERLVAQEPWFGHGGGTYFAASAFDILDNQYLKTAIELGLIGLVALAAYFLVPLITAFVARRRSRDPELRLLCAALAGAALAATVCSFTFDSLSFPMVPNVHALVIGLIGAAWQLSARAGSPDGAPSFPAGSIGAQRRAREPASSTRYVQPGG